MEHFGKFQPAMLITVENGSEGNRFHKNFPAFFGVSHRHLWQLIESELRPRRWAGIPVTSGGILPLRVKKHHLSGWWFQIFSPLFGEDYQVD